MEQGTQEWFEARLGKVTASKISDVMAKGRGDAPSATAATYMSQLVCERLTGKPTETFTSAAMEHGNETEAQARAMYSLEKMLSVEEVGSVDHPTLKMASASPDGLVGDDGLVEIKCPQPKKHIANLMGGKIDRAYMLQMQWQMECTGRVWCDFVSFNPDFPAHMQIHIQRVERDDETLDEIRGAVFDFLERTSQMVAELNGKYETAAE
jgi:putative phage-type endonuclease